VPYFIVWPKGAKADGLNPTLLYGYGGFEVSQQPWYSAGFGTAWYAHGGVLVVAGIVLAQTSRVKQKDKEPSDGNS
jgi:prolyl oligopeptidase